MAYKARFRPLERLGPDGWRRMDEPEPETATGSIVLPDAALTQPAPDRRLALSPNLRSRDHHRANDACCEQPDLGRRVDDVRQLV